MSLLALPLQIGRDASLPCESREAIHRWIRQRRPHLPEDAPTFRAAVILCGALRVGQNVDKLARFSGYPREFVARCARRLYDNGVWRNSATISCWSEDEAGELAFWADVGVAEGRMCRTLDPDGTLHWAPCGHWWKSFDYVAQAASLPPVVSYQPREEWSGTYPCDPGAEADPQGETTDPDEATETDQTPEATTWRSAAPAEAQPPDPDPGSRTAGSAAAPDLPSLFPHAAWLG